MEFKDSQSYKCFNSICLWSLLGDLLVVISFFVSYAFSFIYHDWGYVGWIVPLLVKLFFVFCFVAANGYFAFILYSEYRKNEQNLPLVNVRKTEEIFNKNFKNDAIKNFIIFLSRISFILNLFIAAVNFYTILIGLAAFGISFTIHNDFKSEQD